ncbi:MAG: DNA helicase II [Gammaproteobacteria bacterium]|nr:DNA helicase II [Gammaproteobacteria bacterium]NNJ72528.1 DNA helicase II [Enterobacterales bacterium]
MLDDVSTILEELNDAQRNAVCAPAEPLLILAGAGTGKTRVLVHRIAWLIQAENHSPYSILAVTFTNKAAREMRSRVEHLLGMDTNTMWIGTFHGIAHRLLRAHATEADLPDNFQILDSDDQLRLIKRVMRENQVDEKQWPPRQAQWFINAQKDDGLRAKDVASEGDFFTKMLHKVYTAYEQQCQQSGLVDFAELLLRAVELWQKQPALLKHYQQRFAHVLVDEFQDTNKIQYQWIKSLCQDSGRLTIVGDDDQSIYGWRGAKVENILDFENDFKGVQTIRLEQNYRSTSTILNAANAVINHNQERLGKQLWTEGLEGDAINIYAAFNEQEEARFIGSRIKQYCEQDVPWGDVAILYRSNAQSRVLEEALLSLQIPYRIYGGLRFFERAEIKDALSYLRLVANPNDDAAIERVLNVPPRGIGMKTIDLVRQKARAEQCTSWQAIVNIAQDDDVTKRISTSLQHFINLIIQMNADCLDQGLVQQMQVVIEQSGLKEHYQKGGGEKAQSRIENLDELVNACRDFEDVEIEENMTPMMAFLSHAALESGEQQASEFDSAVQMMTLHSAKGLEFPYVFIAGVEEGLFPHNLSIEDPIKLEEERRLCYVGITRAMQQLFLCWAEKRRLYGTDHYHSPSRFLDEIPEEYTQEIRLNAQVSRPYMPQHSRSSASASDFAVGQRLMHPKFGEGTVIHFEGQGQQARIQINFESVGSKWLVLAYARLTPC